MKLKNKHTFIFIPLLISLQRIGNTDKNNLLKWNN